MIIVFYSVNKNFLIKFLTCCNLCNILMLFNWNPYIIAVENEVADNMYQRSELDYLIYNDPIGYADLILNGDPETYLKTVTEYKPLDS